MSKLSKTKLSETQSMSLERQIASTHRFSTELKESKTHIDSMNCSVSRLEINETVNIFRNEKIEVKSEKNLNNNY